MVWVSLSLCPRRTWQRVLKLEDRHDITHALIYTISSIFNWRIWFAERQTWVNERENDRPGVPFLSPGVTLEITPLLSLWFRSETDTRQKDRRERERERETRHFDTRISLEHELVNSLSFCHYQTFSLSFYHYQHIPDEHVYIEKRLLRYTETWRREGGRERDEIE